MIARRPWSRRKIRRNLIVSMGNLSEAYFDAQQRVREIEELLAQYFLDNDPAAREWLRAIAQAHREQARTRPDGDTEALNAA